ncbi:MAG: phosphoribosyltransferase family protein [Pseudomonadota bacterium]
MIFEDRHKGGQKLVPLLKACYGKADVVVLGVARGGVPVAYEISPGLHAAMDVMLIRRLGVPENRELAMGCVASGGVRLINFDIVEMLKIEQFEIDIAIIEAEREIQRLERYYRRGRANLELQGRTVIVADDGIATGITMRAAISAVKQRGAARVVAAAPTAAPHACLALGNLADEVVCVSRPNPYVAVSRWYRNFVEIRDDSIRESLERARRDVTG